MSAEDAAEEDLEQPDGGGPVAGGCVIALGIGLPLAGVFAASRTAGVLAAWGIGVAALWRAARSVPSAANPAPPPPPEGVGNAKSLFTVVEDRPGHCTIVWQKER